MPRRPRAATLPGRTTYSATYPQSSGLLSDANCTAVFTWLNQDYWAMLGTTTAPQAEQGMSWSRSNGNGRLQASRIVQTAATRKIGVLPTQMR